MSHVGVPLVEGNYCTYLISKMIDSLAVLEILNTRARRMLDVVSIQLRIYCGQIGKMPQRINEHFKQKVCSLEFIQKAHLVPPERLIKLVLLWYPSLVA